MIQARVRGYLTRRQIEKTIGRRVKAESVGNKVRHHSRNFSASGKMNVQPKLNGQMRIVYAKMLTEIPNYSNQATRQSERQAGPFKYDEDRRHESEDLITRGPYELDNGSVYQGQWSREGLRQGRGIQIWPDGAKFEGYWKNDMANGRGRLIHADGDVYEGMW